MHKSYVQQKLNQKHRYKCIRQAIKLCLRKFWETKLFTALIINFYRKLLNSFYEL